MIQRKWFRILLFSLFTAFVVISIGFIRYGINLTNVVYKKDKSISQQNSTTVKDTNESSESDTGCKFGDSLEYFYYNDAPQDWEPNNKFGLYVYAENKDYIEIAQTLVNSNGGEWGYVLIPYNVKDRDYDKWSRVFDQLVNKKLIPIIQLWDVDVEHYKDQTKKSAEFLNDFVWPIKYRYISVYNEPNDSRFWYNTVDPAEYAKILDYTISNYKAVNPDFFMLNGALNVSAPSDANHMDAFEYMKEMNDAIPGIFDRLDGWASHSYPQPNFSGSPYSTGRWSIVAYDSELNYLKEFLDVKKDLPVFITETGWAHSEGESYNASYLDDNSVANYLEYAFNEIWLKDDRVRAVTPFTIWYNPPFDHFAWINKDKVPYKHFDVVKSMKKEKGEPPSLQKGVTQVNNCR